MSLPLFNDLRYNDDGLVSNTSRAQVETENDIASIYDRMFFFADPLSEEKKHGLLRRREHVSYLKRMVGELSVGFTSLESSRPWLVYWCVHGLDVLGELEGDTATKQSAIAALRLCLHEDGGFKGNVTGEPHLATTYAAIVSIAAVNTDEGYSLVDRKLLHSFLMKMKQPDGSFLMHKGGETDVRGAFCALSTAVLCGICSDDLRKGVGDYIRTCQTYEGGFGGEPGNEAHGGYAFCAFAALRLIGEETSVDLNALAVCSNFC
uniref:Prenyltransferase alpha-alpha toroid domain-containing protein n=1 Tax=Palpitomonas bilix TaxID=652834 RepID=A0A7S3DE47_9EUKA|mmetsp:Transcript_33831/g.86820  ORF Transcript_33831/g.86820 Transcript_33831/m.86820 type:complete len:263 (+) Transcript_33831:67-855(+)